MHDMTTQVLSELLSGQTRSGQDIATRLGISRAAVWKHVTTLRTLGYEISSRTGAGYTLTLCPDHPHAVLVHQYYSPVTLGKTIIYLPECGSTNSELRLRAEAGAPAGLVIATDEQHEGRGRRGRTWTAARGTALLFSVLLRPQVPPGELAGLTLLAGVAVAEALKALGVSATLKWPNDVHIAGKKVCGILAELCGELDYTNYVILGIGVNVWDHPQGGDYISTSLAAEGLHMSRANVLAAILTSLEVNIGLFTAGQQVICLEKWRQLSTTLGRRVSVHTATATYTGLARDITPLGALVVALDDGLDKVFATGDVTLRGAGA